MTEEMKAELKIEERAWRALDNIHLRNAAPGIDPDDPDKYEKEAAQLQAVYSDLRALLRVPLGDNITDHYFRINDLATTK